jgi:hypothetical protein
MAAITGHTVEFDVPSPEAMANALGTPRPDWADECGVQLVFNVDLPPAGLDDDLPAWAVEQLRRLGNLCLTAAARIERAYRVRAAA